MFGRRLFAALAALLFALLPLLSAGATPQYPPLASANVAGWSSPVNVSPGEQYDNTPSIAASPNGAVSVIWMRSQGANLLLQARNTSLGGPFQQEQLAEMPERSSGGPNVRLDALGRKHIVWWQYEGATVCDYYVRIEADNRVSIREEVPGTCGHSYKNVALAIGPGNSAHMLFGQNLQSLFYWVRTDSGWAVQAERVSDTTRPESPTLGVTTQGTVIAAWKDGASDVYTGVRQAPGKWQVENVSHMLAPGCEGDSTTDRPTLAADPTGGMRLAWLDERCDPRGREPTLREPYYREWVPATGWNALPPVRVQRTRGSAASIGMVVDATGTTHMVWVDIVGVYFTLYYASGRGQRFSDPLKPFDAWGRGEDTKDVSLAHSPGYLHLAFGSTRDDPDKDNYYSYLQVATPPPPPTSTPTPTLTPTPKLPSSNENVPGTGSRLFPETGFAVTGVFLDYWNSHGGLRQQGFPISNVVRETSPLDGKSYLMQYFERAVFEYHHENPPTSQVLLSQLGTFMYRKKYPNGAPNQRPNQDALAPFPETGRRVGGTFLQYWQQNGGLAQQGFPISDEFTETSETDGKAYTVQYFERAVFEWHPENQPPNNVLLSLLGVFRLRQQYNGG